MYWLSKYHKNSTRSPLLLPTPAWVCQFNSSCRNLWKWNEVSSDLSTIDLNSKGKKMVKIGIKIIRQSTPCDLEVSEVSEKSTFRIKFVLTHFKMSFFFFFKYELPIESSVSWKKLCKLSLLK